MQFSQERTRHKHKRHRFRKAPFSKCEFSVHTKRKDGVLKSGLEEHLRKAPFSCRISEDGLTVEIKLCFQISPRTVEGAPDIESSYVRTVGIKESPLPLERSKTQKEGLNNRQYVYIMVRLL